MKITNILQEAAGPKVGRKYQHIEDLVLSNGSVGGLHAVERLKNMAEQGGSIELKWDGMPVVYWGRDEKGNFSMIPKNAWAYLKSGKTQTSSGAPTVMNSPEDVKAFVLGTGGGDPKAREAFSNQFASLWPYFEKISPKQGYLEGGLLFYPGTKPDGTTAMPVLNKETNTYDFTPNITTFHIPVDSDLGKQIAKSKLMVAATGYYPTMGSSDEQRYPDAQKLSVPGVIVQGTTYVQEPVKMDKQGLANLEAFIKKNAKLIDNYLAPKPGLSNPGGELYAYANKHLRTEGLLRDFPEWAKANMSEKKAQMMLSDPMGLQATLGAVEGITNQKNVLIGQLSQGLHGGIKQTKPEGYAQAHPGAKFKYDIPGQFIKAIDQTNWKPRESVMEKANQASKPIVVGWGRGMGHTGHDALVSAVIHQASQNDATPAFFVSRSFGKDDPIPPETKVAMYKKKFPKYAPIFRLPSPEKPTINDVLADLAAKGFTDATLVVGADQKDAFGYLTRPDKSGVPPYQKFGFNSFNVISRQETGDPMSDPKSSKYHEGPRATPMRQVLMDPSKSEQEQFQVWRQAMSPSLSDEEVLQMMRTAKENLTKFNMPKPKVKKASELKEFIEKVKLLLPESNQLQKEKIYSMLLEARDKINESAEDALRFATQAHAGQTRAGGEPYITHPMRVADSIKQYKKSHNLDALISAALLHDTIEDTDTTHEALHDLFGGLVASLVQELTSDKEKIAKMGKSNYLAQKMATMSSYALVIKLADRLDNVQDIATAKTPEWRAKYKAQTERILDYIENNRVLSGTHRKLIGLIRAKLSEIDNPELKSTSEVSENMDYIEEK